MTAPTLIATPEPPFDPEPELLAIFEAWAVHVPDSSDRVFVPAHATGLVDELLAWGKRCAS